MVLRRSINLVKHANTTIILYYITSFVNFTVFILNKYFCINNLYVLFVGINAYDVRFNTVSASLRPLLDLRFSRPKQILLENFDALHLINLKFDPPDEATKCLIHSA